MALTFFWRCEGTTLDGTDDYTLGDSTASLINSGAIEAAAARVGTNGLTAPASAAGGGGFNLADNGIFPGTLASPSDLVCSFAFSMKWDTAVASASGTSAGFKFQGTAANDYIQVLTTNPGSNLTLGLRNATNGLLSLTTTGSAITADNWFGVVCRLNFATDDRKIEIYNAAGTLVDSAEDTSTDLASYVPADIKTTAGMILGQHSGTHAQATYFDNFIISDAYDAPLQNNLTITSATEYSEEISALTNQQPQFYRRPNTLLRM